MKYKGDMDRLEDRLMEHTCTIISRGSHIYTERIQSSIFFSFFVLLGQEKQKRMYGSVVSLTILGISSII